MSPAPQAVLSSPHVLSVEEVARELLPAFVVAVMPRFQFGAHHAVMARALMKVESGELMRLLIEAPPRHTKTLMTSTLFVAWYLGRHPEHEIILATYNSERAQDLGKALRDVLRSPAYRALFPGAVLRTDSQSATDLMLTAGGMVHSIGVKEAATGRGAHLFVIDDPIKDRASADSPADRRALRNWYSSVATTRLFPDGRVVIMATRWHTQDLTGMILEADPTNRVWTELRMPAMCDDPAADPLGRPYGAPLWPEWYPLVKLTGIRDGPPAMLERDWTALYQQRPVSETGGEFKREWFAKRYTELPTLLNLYLCSDFGVTESGDPTELGVFGIDPMWNIYVVDWWGKATTPDVWIEAMLDLKQQWHVKRAYGEGGVIRHSVNPMLVRRMRERQIFVPVKWLNPVGNKTMRVQGFRARAAAGNVRFPQTDWAEDVIDQLCEFPAGRHDDKVDVCGMIGRVLDDMSAAMRKPEADADLLDPHRDLKPFSSKWLEFNETDHSEVRFR